jgi:hypothetical protein
MFPLYFFSKHKTGSLVTQKQDQESKLKPANNDLTYPKEFPRKNG